MATLTERGSNTAKASGTTLTVTSVSASAGEFLHIIVAGQTNVSPSTVTWGVRDLNKSLQRIHTTPNFTANYYTLRNVANSGTRTITCTWASAINTKIALAFTLDEPFVVDEVARNILTASTAPTVGPTATHLRRDDFCVGLLLAEGPTTDSAPTSVTAGWTTGTRVGTAGAPPVGNLTANWYHQQATDCTGVTLAGTAATARDWIGLISAYRPAELHCVDYYGSQIEAGDTVEYLPDNTTYTVNTVFPKQNSIDIGAIGRVSAVDCEVLN